jgi:hypothetical protein
VSLIDDVLPHWDVNEVHSKRISAPSDATYAAILALTPLDVRLLVPLMALRALPGLVLRRASLSVDLRAPLTDVFVRNGFQVLAERPGEELVLGVVGQFWNLGGSIRRLGSAEEFLAFAEPGHAKAATNFVVRADGADSRVTTETRVVGTDEDATRMFRRYWRVVMPGSAVIRRSWLAAIARRATS